MIRRFARTRLLLTAEELDRLQRAQVGVFGLGAVGSYAVEALARAGIGRLRLIDFDIVRETNFNRQLFAVESALGRRKAGVAKERILQINPGCIVDSREQFVDAQCAAALLEGVDAAIDAIDSLNPKVALIRNAMSLRVPLIASMGAGARLDPLAVKVGDIAHITTCPLARLLRKRLRAAGIRGGVRCVYSLEPPRPSPFLADADEEEFFPRGRARQPIGTISYMPGIFGLTCAAEAIRMIIGGSKGGLL